MDNVEFDKQVFVGKIKSTGLYRLVPIPKELDLKEGEEVIIVGKEYFDKIGMTSGLILEKDAYDAMKAMFEGQRILKK